jgi:hypothetical protein
MRPLLGALVSISCALAACVGNPVPASPHHPANPDAPVIAEPAAPDAGVDIDAADEPSHDHHHHHHGGTP